MLKIILIITLGLIHLSASSLYWLNNLDSAVAKAQKLHTPILVFVYSNTCHFCRDSFVDLAREPLDSIFSDQEDITEVAINKNSNQLHKYDLQTNSYPTYFILDEYGEKITKPLRGYVNSVDEFAVFLRQIINLYKQQQKY